ncbi:calumenin-A [Carica papaya]|uniref:calumenin-A n=1 Tax=Carica papaya TaxID=3649 RepID=UPI000B8CDE6E|nr:calumenin-A [Carica papaya]
MVRAVVFMLLATAFIFFTLKKQHGQTQNRRPTRRLGYKININIPPAPVFDPLVTKMERLHQAHEKEGGGENDGDNDRDDYFTDEGKLNVTLRLIVLFPLLDTAPKDGFVCLKELETWNLQQAEERLIYRTIEELRLRDRDGDGMLSFSECLPRFSKEDIEKNETGHGEAGWWNQQFINADADKNGLLDFDEFNNFLHPEDSNNEEIQKWVLREKIRGMDSNGDGKLDFTEFVKHTYDTYRIYMEFETLGAQIPTAEEKFADLDTNNDEFLVVEELRPIIRYLQPGELSYAKYYSHYLIREADDVKDGKLSLEEMLNHEHSFYNTVFDDIMDDDYDDFHDEL